jgi:rhodanese-related sulfurtransferase/DNA-binding transcriptional ArsR family regulator
MADHAAKVALNEQFAKVAKALANPRRLEILDVLAQGPRTVEVLASEAQISVALASSHLKVLREAGLVAARRNRQSMYYRLTGDEVYALVVSLRAVALAHVPDVRPAAVAYLGRLDDREPLSRADLWARMPAGDVTVLDVRPTVEYEAGHIPGAISVPIDELAARIAALPPGREVVTYCRGPYCVMAPEGVELLRSRGLAARRLEDGLPEWRLAGFPVASGVE